MAKQLNQQADQTSKTAAKYAVAPSGKPASVKDLFVAKSIILRALDVPEIERYQRDEVTKAIDKKIKAKDFSLLALATAVEMIKTEKAPPGVTLSSIVTSIVGTNLEESPEIDPKPATPEEVEDAKAQILAIAHNLTSNPFHIIELTRYLANPRVNVVYMAQMLTDAEAVIEDEKSSVDQKKFADETLQSLIAFIRPENSILHSVRPCPHIFLQKGTLYIDGVNVSIAKSAEDPDFWWQPVTNPFDSALGEQIKAYRDAVSKQLTSGFMNIRLADPNQKT
jgi:hypothetical protein